MAASQIPSTDDPEALAQEVLQLREQVVELQRRMARFGDGGVSQRISDLDVSISEREELLVEAERIAHMGSWVWDVETGSVSWSDELYRILGYDPETEKASIERYFAAIHPDDRDRVAEESRSISVTGVAPRSFYRVLRRDGTIRHVQTNAAVLFDATGKLRRIVGVILDITESRESAVKLEQALHLLQDAQQVARLGSWSYEVGTSAVTWSRELFHILGLPPDTSPSLELFLSLVHPDDRPVMRAHLERLVAAGDRDAGADPIDARIVRPDGAVRHVRVRSRAERALDGQVTALRGVLQDVTDATLLQKRLARAEKMETIGRLAGGIAHEFNNIMMVIHAGAELLVGDAPADPEILSQVKDAVASARDLTSRLLAFGRQSTLHLQRIDPNVIVRDTVRLVQRILGEQVSLEVDLAPDVPRAMLDPHLTGQALINLLINARDAMPGGGRIVLTSRRINAPGGPFVELGVRDHGPGIAADLRERVFEPFFTTKAEGHGTGLGLAMVQGAVEQQGGSVAFESGDDGTTFRLRFAGDTAGLEAERGVASHRPPGRRLRILVVEDQENLGHMVQRLLERAGHEVWTVNLPSAALAFFRERSEDLDLIVSDVLMPEMSGTELLERLAAIGPLPRVVLMSGYGADAIRAPGPERVILSKPFTFQELLVAIERAIG